MKTKTITIGLVLFALLSTLSLASVVDAREREERTIPHRERTPEVVVPAPTPEPEPTPPYLDPIFITKEVLERWKVMLEEGNLEEVMQEYEYYITHDGQLPPEEEENTGDEGESGEGGSDGEDGADGEVSEDEEETDEPRRGPRTREINRTRGGEQQEEAGEEEEETTPAEEEEEDDDFAPDPTEELTYLEKVAYEINRLTNIERENLGLKPLAVDETLEELAVGHSEYMAESGLFSHTEFKAEGECNFTCRLEDRGYVAQSWGENIAWRSASTFPEAEELALHFLRGWINSDGHKDNILSEDFNMTGIGLAQIGNTIFATADFAEVPE